MKELEINPNAKNKKIYYFAYGMLTDPNKMNTCVEIGRGILSNYELEINHFCNIHSAPGKQVFGAVWEITPRDLRMLDYVEGVPKLYNRRLGEVTVGENKYNAYFYEMTDIMRNDYLYELPTSTYISDVLFGYDYFNIPREQLLKAFRQCY